MRLSPLPARASTVDACASALRDQILSGELAPGARLPPERSLAETFGASRVTVRSALAQLASARLLSVRQGSGHVVRDFRKDGGPELVAGLLVQARGGKRLAEVVADLLFVRRHIARAVLERVITSATPARLRDLDAAIDRFERAASIDASVDALAEADVEIVAALLAATESVVLNLCANPVFAVVRGIPALREAMYRTPSDNVAAYRLLAAWAKKRDPRGVELLVGALAERDAATVAHLSTRRRQA